MPGPITELGVQPVILTIDNGGTSTRAARGGQRIDQIVSYKTPHQYDEAIDKIAETTGKVLGGKKPDAIGFSVAGAVQNGHIVSAGQLEEYGWVGKPFADDVAAAIGVPVERIVLLNDCAAGANAERVARLGNEASTSERPDVEILQLREGEVGAFNVLSTGFGGGLYTATELIPDETGHRYLKPGATCGDGQEGHIEAHVSGSGIARKFGVPAEELSHEDPRWNEIKGDFHDGMDLTLAHHKSEGRRIIMVGFTGSVALGGPDMLGGLQRDLTRRHGNSAPRITKAVYRDESGLYGAAFAADEVLRTGDAAVVLKKA